MAKNNAALLNALSTADLKRLLVARERIDILEKEQSVLLAALAKVEQELAKLVASALSGGVGSQRRKPGRPKGSGKKNVRKAAKRKPLTAKKTVRKKAVKKVTKKVTKKVAKKVVKKAVRRPAKKANTRQVAAGKALKKTSAKKRGKTVKLEDVIVSVIRKNRGRVTYKDLFSAIVKGKLFESKSDNFDNVLRRTLSTSKMVKRVARGVYGLA